jgi:transposase-like protein
MDGARCWAWTSEAETFWTEFLRRRGLRGAKLAVSGAHERIKAAVSKLMNASWQRCRVHFMRNALAYAGKSGRRVVSAFIATAFAQDHAEAAKAQWHKAAGQLRPKLPKLAAFMDEAETDVLTCMTFPKDHWQKIYSTAWSASTARSNAARRSSASSPTRRRSGTSSAPSCSNKTTNGRFSAQHT